MVPVARVSGLIQGYRRRIVLTGLDLSVEPGVLGLLGPNGAGKTTLFRTLATITPPQAGTLEILGQRITSERSARQARRDIGFLPQDFGFFPGFSVSDFVQYCAWLRDLPGNRIKPAADEAIELVGLRERSGSRLKTLSGGMLRRAGIAAAVVGRPRLLLLDEPTVGLDPAQRLEFRELIRSMPDAGVLLSTHLVEDVAALCDTVAVLNEGKLVFLGRTEELAECADPSAPGDSALERGYMTVLSRPAVFS